MFCTVVVCSDYCGTAQLSGTVQQKFCCRTVLQDCTEYMLVFLLLNTCLVMVEAAAARLAPMHGMGHAQLLHIRCRQHILFSAKGAVSSWQCQVLQLTCQLYN
jgi:hypothetical protein